MAHRLLQLICCVALGGVAASAASSYLGFDRNDYPGDAALPALRRTFRYTGFWLNNPPGEAHDSWTGKRAILKKNGFGFLVLFNGRVDAQLRNRDAAGLGAADGRAAVAAAMREGFAPGVRIFLDQEEGGRLLPEQAAYLLAWIDAVEAAGARAGVYCSGIPVPDGQNADGTARTVTTAQDIAGRLSSISKGMERAHAVALWVADDRCPPAPGCTTAAPPLSAVGPLRTGALVAGPAFIAAWQYAQSPRRAQFSASCPRNQAPDGNCYAPGLPHSANTFVDLDVAGSSDPSEEP